MILFAYLRKYAAYLDCCTVDSPVAWKTMQILIRWLHQKPSDLDLHCFLKRICLGSAGQVLILYIYICRYFDCRPRYGLFAPVHKVTKMSSNTPSLMSRSLGSAGLKLSRDRSGSQESVSSLSSATSSASRPRVRLGVTALNGSQV